MELDINDASVDLTKHQFDAGIRVGALVERDMVAVKLTPDTQWLVVGAPAYFARYGRPRSPEDLTKHECIRWRFPTRGAVERWKFVRKGREYSIDPPSRLVVNDTLTVMALAEKGLGLAYAPELLVAPALASRRLEAVLQGFLPKTPTLFLYFPARSQAQPKLRAFIDVAKRVLAA